MPGKLLSFFIVFTLLLASTAVSNALAVEKTPERLVEEFYAWYLGAKERYNKRETEIPAEMDDNIFKYLHACTVNKLRIDMRKGFRDFNYFLGSNDYDPDTLYKAFPAMKITDEVSIVPVGEKGEPYFVVFVQKMSDGWRIIKVEFPR